MANTGNPLRPKVIQLYKTGTNIAFTYRGYENFLKKVQKLLYLGKEYPMGADYFRTKLKAVFRKNKDIKDPAEIEKLIQRGNYVVKEIEALYMLRKYRTLKRRYYDQPPGNKGPS